MEDSLIEVVRDALSIALMIIAPILGAGVVIGLTVSILQAVTSIQEQTLVFVPKVFGMLVITILLMGWIVQRLADFAVQMLSLSF